MYKNNSGFIAKSKISKYKNGLGLTEKLVRENPLLFLYLIVVSNLTKPRKIELNLGNPKNGWLPIELKSAEFELEFIASNIPENPTDKLCESLILAING